MVYHALRRISRKGAMPHLRANLWQSTYPNRLSASKLDVEKLDVEKLSIFRLLPKTFLWSDSWKCPPIYSPKLKSVHPWKKHFYFIFWRQKSTNSPYKLLWQGEEEEEEVWWSLLEEYRECYPSTGNIDGNKNTPFGFPEKWWKSVRPRFFFG